MNKGITVYRSPDRRLRTSYLENGGQESFCIAEKTSKGTLISYFTKQGKILDQIYYKEKSLQEGLSSFLASEIAMQPVDRYERVAVQASCKKCSKSNFVRELDLVDTSMVEDVPVVPIFRCLSCGQRAYSMSSEYLRRLVERNDGLFDEKETAERQKDMGAFMRELNEYIIRIFASKKISKLEVKE